MEDYKQHQRLQKTNSKQGNGSIFQTYEKDNNSKKSQLKSDFSEWYRKQKKSKSTSPSIPFCLCFSAQQNQRIFTTRQVPIDLGIKSMINRWIQKKDTHQVKKTIVQLLRQLYENGKSMDKFQRLQLFNCLKNKRLNPQNGSEERQDLQFFIPQLLTYLVYQIDLNDQQLLELVLNACQTHYVFSHFCYFYLQSLSEVYLQQLKEVRKFINQQFLPRMELYKQSKLCGFQLAKCSELPVCQIEPTIIQAQAIKKYGTIDQDQILIDKVKGIKIQNYSQNGYLSTPNFWQDLVDIGLSLNQCNPKRIGLLKALKDINKKLPSAVYIPFFKQNIRYYTILNIDCQFAKVFSTKERSPYAIYIEIFRQQQQFYTFKNQISEKMSKPLLICQQLNSLKLHRIPATFKVSNFQDRNHHILNMKTGSQMKISQKTKIRRHSVDITFQNDHQQSIQRLKILRDQFAQTHRIAQQTQTEMPLAQMPSSIKGEKIYIDRYFDTPFQQIERNIKKKSIYKNFKTWRLVHIMVKTGDDLKQQQFAMQLIKKFDMIFKKQKTGLFLRSYQVLSLGPDYGILEMVCDASPLARIFKVMQTQQIKSLKQFFKSYFKGGLKQAQKNFCKSLAAYSLVTYFLQIKDRHNQNILLDRKGHIMHIDFGFLLSSAPGKGVQIQKNVPFKLTSDYVDVLGGPNSQMFREFRKMFNLGFKAALKHKTQIITLVKMMYSSHGESMRCFKKGVKCIDQLEARFTPKTHLLYHCNNLINESLDNWRARWYDKFQYILQGISY